MKAIESVGAISGLFVALYTGGATLGDNRPLLGSGQAHPGTTVSLISDFDWPRQPLTDLLL